MVDSSVGYTPGVGANISVDSIGSALVQRMKPAVGISGTAVDVSAVNPMPVVQRTSTSTLTSVTADVASTVLLVVNANRRGAYFFNDSTAQLYLALADTASLIEFTVRLNPGDMYELPLPVYTGNISGIWSTVNGTVRVTEVF